MTFVMLPFFSPVALADSPPFNDPLSSLSNWTYLDRSQDWSITTDNVLRVARSSNTGRKAIAESTDFSNFQMDVEIRPSGSASTGDVGVLFRVTSYSAGTDNTVGFYAGFNLSRRCALLGTTHNNWSEIAASANNSLPAFNTSTWYPVRIVAIGPNISVYVTDLTTPRITFKSSDHISGKIGLRAYNLQADYRNLKVTPIEVEPVGIKPVAVYTTPGVAPELPSQVTMLYNDDSETLINGEVTWDPIMPAQYATAGSAFSVEGSIEGSALKAVADIKVVSTGLGPGESPVVSNAEPLLETPFTPLPLGSVEARGWLLKQLELQKSGLTGLSEEIYSECGPNSAWLGGNAGNSDWERPVYYVKGLIALAYTLKDPELIDKANKWIEWTLINQQSNGFIGPSSNTQWWPRMVMLYALKDYYEATGDSRVLTVMTNYFLNYQQSRINSSVIFDWAKARVGDNIDTVLWLYNHTKNPDLLNVATLLKGQDDNQTGRFNTGDFFGVGSGSSYNSNGYHRVHIVNVNQSMKLPPVYYQLSKDTQDRIAFRNADSFLLKEHGQVTGMPNGTEMLSSAASNQGTELCAIVERMQTNEEAQMILGDPYIGDELERIAFNALPANLDATFTGLQYYSMPNQVQSVRRSHGFSQDYDTGLTPSPESGYPCCRFNLHMGWPYYVKNMWAASAEGGIAVMAYGPSSVTTKIGDTLVSIEEDTVYPFEETIRFTVSTESSTAFPLTLRIPAWSKNTAVKVNGVVQSGVVSGQYFTINRTWINGDTVTVETDMELKTTSQVNNSIAVERGPLVYSLKIDENWTRFATYSKGLGAFEVTPNTPWQYGLNIDPANPAASIVVNKGLWPTDDNPFVQSATPVTLSAPAKRVTNWSIGPNGADADEVPLNPIFNATTENITLVPYGAENIRLTYFPIASLNSAQMPVKYEAESAKLAGLASVSNYSNTRYSTRASNSRYVGTIDNADSYVEFTNVYAPEAGDYDLHIVYASNTQYGAFATQTLTVNDNKLDSVKYAPFQGAWERFQQTSVVVPLKVGNNKIKLGWETAYAQLDYIWISPTGGTEAIAPLSLAAAMSESNGAAEVFADIYSGPDNLSGNLIAAVYDIAGRLANISVQAIDLPAATREVATFAFDVSDLESGYSINVFLWDKITYVPLVDKAEASASIDPLVSKSPETFCNPVNIDYKYMQDSANGWYRLMADVQPVYYQDLYWIFPTHTIGYFYSTDLINWQYVYSTQVNYNNVAPGAFVLNDYLYVARDEGAIYRTNDPKDGAGWTLVSAAANTLQGYKDVFFFLDPDTDRLFMLHGCQGISESNMLTMPVISIVELDTTSPTLAIKSGQPRIGTGNPAVYGYPVLYLTRTIRGYEVTGQNNDNYGATVQGWLEGGGMIKHDGKYYAFYAGPGTEFAGYSDACYVADDPLGPYTWCENGPFSYKSTGFLPGEGHGHTVVEQDSGRIWKFGTNTISNIHQFERRVSLFPIDFNAKGLPTADLSYADYPMYVPTNPKGTFEHQGPGWKLLSYGAAATASSTYNARVNPIASAGVPAFDITLDKAFDENIRTWWSAATGEAGEWLQCDLGKVFTVNSVQVNFADQNTTRPSTNVLDTRNNSYCYKYLLEYSLDGENWFTIADKSNYMAEPNMAQDYSHEYYELVTGIAMRYVRVTNKGPAPVNGKFAISGLRVFGDGGGGDPAKLDDFTLSRVEGRDGRTVQVSWNPVDPADSYVGYIVRFGTDPNDLNLCYQTINNSSVIIPILSTYTDLTKSKPLTYYFRVDTYNDSGKTIGTTIKSISGDS